MPLITTNELIWPVSLCCCASSAVHVRFVWQRDDVTRTGRKWFPKLLQVDVTLTHAAFRRRDLKVSDGYMEKQ